MITASQGGFLIGKIKQIQARVFEKLLIGQGIDEFNGAQGRILFVLWRTDGIAISELAAQTGLAKTTLTSMLDRMEASGFVHRGLDPKDRRKTILQLTERAKGLRAEYDSVSARMNEIFYEGFSDEEIARFEAALLRILDNLESREAST